MMNSRYRPFVLGLIATIIMSAAAITQAAPVEARASSTPAQINGIFNPDTIYPSQTSRLTINVYNPNSGQLTDVNWTDTLPDDLIIVNPANPSVAGCGTSYTLTATPGTNIISLDDATVLGTTNPVNPGICSITVSVTSFTASNHTNVIHKADGSVNLAGVVSNYEYDANITLLVLPMSAPTMGKSFNPDTMAAGGSSRLTLTINNPDSHVALTQVALHDAFPTGMSLFNTTSTLSGCGGGSFSPALAVDATEINLTGATIAANGTCTISVYVKVSGTGTFPNIIHPADLTDFQKVTIPSNVSASLTVENIQVGKYYSPDNFQVGGRSTLFVELTNPNTTDALTNVHFTDPMDPAVSVIPGTGLVTGPAGCLGTIDDSVPSAFTLNGGEIPASTTCTYQVDVTSSSVGSHSNTLDCTMISFDGPTAGCSGDSTSIDVYATGLGLDVRKAFQNPDIEPGTRNRMTIRIIAPGDTDLTSFNLTDNLPADVYVANPPDASAPSGCGAGTFTAVANASSVSLTNATITAGSTCLLRVYVTSSVYGPHTNTIHPADITNTSLTGQRNIPADVSATFTVRDISVSKTFTNSTIGKNGITRLTITLTNNYTKDLTGIDFTDALPGTDPSNGIFVASPANLNNTCNGTVTADPGTNLIILSDGSIPGSPSGGVTCTISVDVQGISSSATPSDSYTNEFAIKSVTGYVDGTTFTQNWHTASAGIRVGAPDFRINKKFDPILVTGDTASTMTITLVNTESSPVSNISFVDTLPTHMLLAVPSSPSTGMCGGTITPAADRKSFTYNGGALAGSSQCQLTIRAMMEVTGNLINTIPATAVTTREGMTNHDPTSATLTNLSSVGITKKFSPNPVSPGSTSTIILDIQKNGIAIGLTGLRLTDDLPTGLTIAPAPAETNTCGGTLSAPAGGTQILLTNGVMPIGVTSCRVTVDVLVPDTGLSATGYENCIPVGAVSTAEGYNNIFPSCDTLGTIFDPPSGYKIFDADHMPHLLWRMVWINNHNSANINTQIRDTIPVGTVFDAGSLTCEERGSSTRTDCLYDAGANQVYWAGTIGPDRGATTEATANNEVVITFTVTVPGTTMQVNNQSPSLTDTDDDSDFTDETTTASVSNSNLAVWTRYTSRPRSGNSSDDDVNAKSLPASGFTPGITTILPDEPEGLYSAIPSLKMEIPALGLTSDIVGVYSFNGEWDVSWLGNRLGYLEESAFPTFNGNSVITGHVFDAQGKPGPFNKLSTLKYGDRFTVTSFGQKYTYEVRDVLSVASDDIKAAFKHEERSWITLMTCQGYDEKNNSYTSRVLVRAVLIAME